MDTGCLGSALADFCAQTIIIVIVLTLGAELNEPVLAQLEVKIFQPRCRDCVHCHRILPLSVLWIRQIFAEISTR